MVNSFSISIVSHKAQATIVAQVGKYVKLAPVYRSNTFIMDSFIGLPVFIGCFVLAMIFGAVASKTHFCTLGAVSDWVNFNDKGRFCAWMGAIAVAMAGVAILEASVIIDLDETRPPYRSPEFAWLRYLLGGALFGIGMTLASGCTTKNIIRLGGGSLKALLVLLIVGLCAYLMTRTDFYALVFHSWMAPLSIDLGQYDIAGQDLGSLAALFLPLDYAAAMRTMVAVVIALLLILLILRAADFRTSSDHKLGGLVVGLCVLGGWYLTGASWGQEWIEAAEWLDEPPVGVGVQSFTLVNPMAETLIYAAQPTQITALTFGVIAVIGIFLGALVHTVFSRQFRIEWFASWSDFFRHVIGAVLMGIGGVLALGCTVGQGITGVSTLAAGSLIALLAIIIASATTMKIQYYQMVYEDAGFVDAWLSAWADLRLLPNGLRRLDAL